MTICGCFWLSKVSLFTSGQNWGMQAIYYRHSVEWGYPTYSRLMCKAPVIYRCAARLRDTDRSWYFAKKWVHNFFTFQVFCSHVPTTCNKARKGREYYAQQSVFNLQWHNVARQGERKCYTFYLIFICCGTFVRMRWSLFVLLSIHLIFIAI